jgi:hypothetical protein
VGQASDPKAGHPSIITITLLFVHGTMVRKPGYDDTIAVIREQAAHRHDVRVAECRWGEAHGCQLHAGDASVPTHDATRALGDQLTPEQALCDLLLRDPLGELRLLTVREGERKRLPFLTRLRLPDLRRTAGWLAAEPRPTMIKRERQSYGRHASTPPG